MSSPSQSFTLVIVKVRTTSLTDLCHPYGPQHLPSTTLYEPSVFGPQEKLDHLGIVVLILGTPITMLMAQQQGTIPVDMVLSACMLFGAAFLPPLPRVLGFASGIAVMLWLHASQLMNMNLLAQLLCYGAGAYAFLRYVAHASSFLLFLPRVPPSSSFLVLPSRFSPLLLFPLLLIAVLVVTSPFLYTSLLWELFLTASSAFLFVKLMSSH